MTLRCLAFCLLITLVVGCGRGLIINSIGQREKIVQRYEEPSGDATILISRWGTIVRKWRVTDDTSGLLYQVDVIARICRSGGQVVPCENVKRDPDMRKFIDW
jgi:hypothetical protein